MMDDWCAGPTADLLLATFRLRHSPKQTLQNESSKCIFVSAITEHATVSLFFNQVLSRFECDMEVILFPPPAVFYSMIMNLGEPVTKMCIPAIFRCMAKFHSVEKCPRLK